MASDEILGRMDASNSFSYLIFPSSSFESHFSKRPLVQQI